MVGENNINVAIFEGGNELGTGLDTGCLAGEAVRFKEPLDKIGIGRVILEQQDPERGREGHFFMLPGGGSLITAQNAPSSLTAFTNS